LDPENEDELKKYLKSHDILDVIHEYNHILIDPQEFVSALSRLTPRLYSIASSQKYVSDEVQLTVGIVNDVLRNRLRKGVSSNHLAGQVSLGESIPLFFNENKSFRLPSSGDTPIIMIGPGTGIAPFRAFLQERCALGNTGKNWLFFGNPHSSTDFLYQEELREFEQKGILTYLSTAFSRDQAEKIYVQDRILENAEKVFSWIENGAHIYICGDAKRMAVDVENALFKVILTQKQCSLEIAGEYLQDLKKSKRYQKDVY
jgi:sulfite reductase (NADPH) flavoprotein alpha-component